MLGFLKLISRVRGISTPFGGLTWAEEKARIPKFEGLVNLTWAANKEFLDFLNANFGKTIGLNIEIDASLSVPAQQEFVDQSPEVFEQIHNCVVSGVTIPLPNETGMIVWLTFNLLNERHLQPSFGGTGIFRLPLKGIFDVTRTAHSGPAVHFHISEESAGVEFRSSVFGG